MNKASVKLIFFFFSLLIHFQVLGGDGERMYYLEGSDITNNAILNVMDPVSFPSGSTVSYSTKVALVYGREQRSDYEGHADWSLSVSYTLRYYTRDYVQIGAPIGGNVLTINFNHNSPVYQEVKLFDQTVHQYGNVILTIDNVSTPAGTPPQDVRLELSLLSSCEHVLGSSPLLSRKGTDLYWSYQHGAKYYQVEWVYLDVKDNGSSGITTGAAAFAYKKGIRVTSSNQHYTLNLTYPEGRVFYRIRGVGYWVNTGSVSEKLGSWVYGSSAIVINSSSPAVDPKPFETNKNWQYSSTYVEGGKYSKSVSYFDGSLRARQGLSQVLSDTTVVVSESKYDYEGRPVVNIIPVPMKGNDLSYQKHFNQFETISKGKASYDNSELSGSEKLLTSSGTSRYYSSDNDVETLHRDYLPDAEGYPYSQVEYVQDGSGRMNRLSEVGKAFRLKDPSQGQVHYTQYIYGSANETELRRLFGSNVGDASHYRKNALVNADGQVSVSYLDMQGRVIATALAGDSTPNHYRLEEYHTEAMVVNLDAGNGLDLTNLVSRSQNSIPNVVPNTTYTFHYDMKGTIAKLASYDNSFCADCRYDLKITVKDPDGEDVIGTPVIKTGIQPSSLNCTEEDFEYEQPDFQLSFAKIGSYTVIKELRLSGDSHDRIEELIESSSNYPVVSSIVSQLNSSLDLTQCDYTCEQHCRSKVLKANPTLTGTDLDVAVAGCVALDCKNIIDASLEDALDQECKGLYDRMRDQVSPGGYYYMNPSTTTVTMQVIWNTALSRLASLPNTNWVDEEGVVLATPTFTQISTEASFNPDWSFTLALGHPEYCHYQQQCITNEAVEKASKLFDINLTRVPGWLEAEPLGLLTPYEEDPYFDVTPGSNQKTALVNWLNRYYQNTSGKVSDCLLYPNNDVLYPGYVYGDASFCGDAWDFSTSANAFNGTVPSSEQSWQLFQSIYRNKKKELQVEARIQSGCLYLTDEKAVFANPVMSGSEPILRNQAVQGINEIYGAEVCPLNVEKWMQRIEYKCGDLVDFDSSNIATHLSTYCASLNGSAKMNPLRVILQGTVKAYAPLIAAEAILISTYGCSLEEAVSTPNPYVYSNYNGEIIVSGYSTCPGSVPHAEGDMPGYGPNLQANSNFNSYAAGWNLDWWRANIMTGGLPYYFDLTNPADGHGLLPVTPYRTFFSTTIVEIGKTYRMDFDILHNPNNFIPYLYNYDDGDFNHSNLLFTGTTSGHQVYEFVAEKTGVLLMSSQINPGAVPIKMDNFTIREKFLCDGQSASGVLTLNDDPIFLGPEETENGNFQQNGAGWYDKDGTLIPNYFGLLNDVSPSVAASQEQSYQQSVVTNNFTTPNFTNGVSWGQQVWNATNNSGIPSLYSPGTILTSALPEGKIQTGAILTAGKTYRLSFNTYYSWLPPGKNPYDVYNGTTLVLANNFNSSPVYHHDYNRPFTVDFIATGSNLSFVFYEGRQVPNFSIGAQLMRMGNVSVKEILPVNCFNVLEDAVPLLSTCIPYHTDANTTLNDLATALNEAGTGYDFTVDLNKLKIKGKPGTGEGLNGKMLMLVADTDPAYYSPVGYKIGGTTTMSGGLAVGKCCDDIFTMEVNWETERQNCIQGLYQTNQYKAEELLSEQTEVLKNKLISEYYKKCFANPFEENFSYSFPQTEYHYSLYYYDQAGNLVMTVPPAGFNPLTSAAFTDEGNWIPGNDPQHYLQSKYKFSSGGQLLWQRTPDAGESHFIYDRKGQIRLSQNAKQRAKSNSGVNVYSYSKVDYLGRQVEVGQLEDYVSDFLYFTDASQLKSVLTLFDDPSFPNATFTKKQIIETVYSSGTAMQDNLRNKVSQILNKNDAGTVQSAIHYSYDVHGNIKHLEQQFAGLGNKTMDYYYDLLTGTTKKVVYQKNQSDQFIHKFFYDEGNRLVSSLTSSNGLIWEEDARYFYQKNGSIARCELGEDKVQGSDYFYSLQGWIKGMNIPEGRHQDNKGNYRTSTDLGIDGRKGSLNSFIAEDEFAYSLGYYQNDYKGIGSSMNMGTTGNNNWNSGQLKEGALGDGLYNGNISFMISQVYSLADLKYENNILIPKEADNYGLRGNGYRYDQLNRLKESRSFNYQSTGHGVNWIGRSNDINSKGYDAQYIYDPNGNIEEAKISSNTVALMDDFKYQYDKEVNGFLKSNRLYHLNDNASALIDEDDIDNQGVFNSSSGNMNEDNNYGYDETGNLIRDNSDTITSIEWSVYGKVLKVIKGEKNGVSAKGPDLEFRYDAMNNRILKIVKMRNPITGDLKPAVEWLYTYYVHDASGNEVASYTVRDAIAENVEYILYGNYRLGTFSKNLISSSNIVNRKPQLKKYELSNHLKNVYVVISSLKLGHDTTDNLISKSDYYRSLVLTANDYYPFGSTLKERTYSSPDYRFGFNGQEKDKEWNNNYLFDYRIHDTRLGRFLSVDPLSSEYPWNSSYAFAENDVIRCIDLEGAEKSPTYHQRDFNRLKSPMRTMSSDAFRAYDKMANSRAGRIIGGIKNTTLGVLGAAASITYIGETGGVGAPLGGAVALTLSIGEIGIGMTQTTYAIAHSEPGDNLAFNKASTFPGLIAYSVNSDYAALYDAAGGFAPSLLTVPLNKGLSPIETLFERSFIKTPYVRGVVQSGCGVFDALGEFVKTPDVKSALELYDAYSDAAGVVVESANLYKTFDENGNTESEMLFASFLYTVQPGDVLGNIAKKFNTSVEQLAKDNHITDVHTIKVGQVLRFGGKTKGLVESKKSKTN